MNPSEIKAVMAQIGGSANKRLGQHFLIDQHALQTIVETADIQPGEKVLEIGPGLGVLTRALVGAGAVVTSVERDARFASYLRTQFTDGFELWMGDAAKLEWESVFKNKDWKFISNLPYSITSLALRKALYAAHPPTDVVVLVQREVAERAIARDQKHSLLSLMVAFASHEAHIIKRVAPGAFFPPPKVESAILHIVPMGHEERGAIWGIDPEAIMSVTKRGFAHPRKLLASNLGIKPEVLESVGVQPKARAEDLSPQNWVDLAKAMG